MRIDFVTLFPAMFMGFLEEGIVAQARRRGLLAVGFANPRDFAKDRHRRVDDRPYGGGPGMVLMPAPLEAAVRSVAKPGSRVVLLSPQGARFDSREASRLSRRKRLVLVCGRYEGIDQRVMGIFDEELSIGDYVLTGGELAAMVVADAVARLLPGVLRKPEATQAESFASGRLDYPQYTRPRVWRGRRVPAVLLSGDHRRIAQWRARQALLATKSKRPDLLS